MSSTFGRFFRVTTFGESHGGGVGAVVDGCPPGVAFDVARVQRQLDRRRPGQSALTSARAEADRVEVLSGVAEGRTLGTPILMLVRNADARATDYAAWRHVYRPSHADYTTDAKYGVRAWAGGGRASARETIGRVAAGAVAAMVMEDLGGGEVVAWVEQVEAIALAAGDAPDAARVTEAEVDATAVRCPHAATAAAMEAAILAAKEEGDSVGGIVRCVARGVPAGLGEPVFDKLEALLGAAMLSLPAVKGFEIGSGFAGATWRGSRHNDAFYPEPRGEGEAPRIRTRTNHSGGVQGGISNGEALDFRVAFKPTATIFREQETVTDAGEATTLVPRGRHDPCVVPRAVPIVEAMTRLVLVDLLLRQRGLRGDAALAAGR